MPLFSRLTVVRWLIVCTLCCVWSALEAADYYWIGGTGNWSDISHWATTSGGATTHSQAPTSNDDVFFDANSFTAAGQTVTLNTDVIFCRSLTTNGVTNAPRIVGPAATTITVYGAWVLTAGMTFDFAGQLVFTGATAGNTIDFAGQPAGATLTFSGTGSWTLASAIIVDSTFALNEGSLNTNGQTVDCGYFRSDGQATRSLSLGSSQVIVRRSTWSPFPNANVELQFQTLWIEAVNLTMDPGTSTFELRGNSTDLFFEGPGAINFNRLVLSAPMGNSRLLPWTNFNGFASEPTLTVAELDLRHRTRLSGDASVGNLLLYAGQQYRFGSGRTFNLGTITAAGDCRGSVDLAGTDATVPTTFSSTNNIVLDFATLRSVAATGGGTFTANNAVDLGNNPGWTINPKTSASFYWIGGTGNWNDPSHWASTSGGSSNGCVPSITDDVFFDANSFTGPGQTVTVNVENASCRDMNWTGVTGNPELAGPAEHRMKVGGSLVFSTAMRHTFAGSYVFSSQAAGNTITSNGQPFNADLSFEGGGEWSLTDAAYVESLLLLESGTLRTNNQAVEAQFLRSPGQQMRGLLLGSSYVRLVSHSLNFNFSELQLESTNLNFDAGTSTIEFSGGFSGGVFCNGQQSLAFNVVIFSCPFGQWSHSLFSGGMELSTTVDSLVYNNSGFLASPNTINYCYFAPGNTFELGQNSTQTITELVASGTCAAGMTNILSANPSATTSLRLPAGQSFELLRVNNVTVSEGAPVVASNSVDAGGNTGWQFTAATGRTLYWVGGDGNWYDPARWSLSSGGAGGECVPTALDDVIVDGNSTAGGNLFINNNFGRSAYCRNITYEATLPGEVYHQTNALRVSGSLLNRANLRMQSTVYFNGAGSNTVEAGNGEFFYLVFRAQGDYTVVDNLRAFEIGHEIGGLRFSAPRVEAGRFASYFGNANKTLDLGPTHLVLTQASQGFTDPLSFFRSDQTVVDAGTSLIELTHPTAKAIIEQDIALHNVLFSAPDGDTEIYSRNPAQDVLTTNSLTFNGSGTLSLALTTDTLLCAPGKNYVFAANQTQRVNNYWRIIGNNCTPISLSSSSLGAQATVQMPSTGEILADFIQMRNITGTGGAAFLAGSRSTNIGNSNVNWVFETAPQFRDVGFLGEDRSICLGSDLTLSAFNFSRGEQYLWHDGSTDTTFTTNQAGTYFVQVTFETSCVIRDTIVVLDAQAFSVDLPDNPVICAGDSLTLVGDAGINSATYRWQDGSTDPTLTAFTSGEYFVVVDLGGCIETDTTFLTLTPLPSVDLGPDPVACAGQSFTLSPTVSGTTLQWQDGSSSPTFAGNQPGIYWLEATNGNCSVRDSAVVTYVDPGTVSLGADTTLCTATQLTLAAGVPGANYRWQDGSTAPTFTATTSGAYSVEINLSGCRAADTINVVFANLATLELASDYQACQGETLAIRTAVLADAFRWSNGQTGPNFNTATAGTYSLEADFGPCTVRQDFTVAFLVPPVLELGPDIEECAGIPISLDAGQPGTWQDGSTGRTFTVTLPGQYRVEVSNGACTVADSLRVAFRAPPQFSLGEDRSACVGETIRLQAPTGLGTLAWEDGSTDPERVFTSAANPVLSITDATGCVGTASLAVTFLPLPTLDLGPDSTVCDDAPFLLRPTSSGGTISWPDGSTGPTYEVISPGTIIALVNDGSCANADTVRIAFRECIYFQAYLPTAFSPNGDGINDGFGPLFDPRLQILNYRLQIFSRWGDQVFVSEDFSATWDGTFRGKALDTGPFLYAIDITYQDDRGTNTETLAGDFMLLR